MQLVIADTGPVNYLILIGHIDVLPALFEKVILPAIVRDELKHRKAPLAVQSWIADPPPWVEVRQTAQALTHRGIRPSKNWTRARKMPSLSLSKFTLI